MSSDSIKPGLIPLVIALLIFGVTGWYGYTNYQQLATLKTHLSEADVALLDLEKEKSSVMQNYQDSKKTALDKMSANQEKLSSIFPTDEDLTGLTRLFDDFAFKNHYANNPFFISQLSYGAPADNESLNARVLPITMTVETSERNFFKFLEFVETSGSVESGVRLLATNGINLQLSDEGSDVMNVQLTLQAYLQK